MKTALFGKPSFSVCSKVLIDLKTAVFIIPTMSLLDRIRGNTTRSSAYSNSVTIAKNTSVSQIEVADLCLRKWWLQREAYLREPQKQSFIIGGKVHDAGERFLGQEPELWPAGWDDGLIYDPTLGIHQREVVTTGVDAAIREGIWSPVPGSYIEYPICLLIGQDLRDGRGLPLVAKAETQLDASGTRRILTPTALIDGSPLPAGWDALPYLVGFIDHYLPAGAGGAEIPVVVDHKTAKNMRYGKKQKDIQTGIQIPIYGAAVLGLHPGHDEILGRYNVFIKDPSSNKRVYMVEDRVGIDHICQVWDHVIAQTEVMVANRKNAPRVGSRTDEGRAANFWKVAASLEDEQACRAFGGCPYRDLCLERCDHVQMTRRMDDALKQTPTPQNHHQPAARTQGPSLLQRLRQSQENQTMPFGTPPPPKPETPQFKAGDHAFITDPDNDNLFYKVYIRSLYTMNDAPQADIIIYPHADIAPEFDTLPGIYQVTVPAAALMDDAPKINHYYVALMEAGWPEHDIQYQRRGEAQTPPKADTPAQAPPSEQDDPYAGAATAQIAAKDEDLSAAKQPDPNQLDPATLQQAEAMANADSQVNVETYQQWVGKKVHIDNDKGNSFRGLCTEVLQEGMRIEGFETPIGWDQVVRVTSIEEVARPGDEDDKKRVDTKKDMDSLTAQSCLERIKTIFEEKKDKETLGKREYRKLIVYLEKMQELINQQCISFDQDGVGAVQMTASVRNEDAEEAFQKGIKEGIKQAEVAIQLLLKQP